MHVKTTYGAHVQRELNTEKPNIKIKYKMFKFNEYMKTIAAQNSWKVMYSAESKMKGGILSVSAGRL